MPSMAFLVWITALCIKGAWIALFPGSEITSIPVPSLDVSCHLFLLFSHWLLPSTAVYASHLIVEAFPLVRSVGKWPQIFSTF